MKFPVYTIQSHLWDKIYTQQLIRTLFSLFGVYHPPSGNELREISMEQERTENRQEPAEELNALPENFSMPLCPG